VLKLRVTGAVLPLPSYMFMAWAGIILPLPLHYLLLYPLQYWDLYTELILPYTWHETDPQGKIEDASWKMRDKLMLDLTLRRTKDGGYSGDLHLIISTLLCHNIHGILTEGEHLQSSCYSLKTRASLPIKCKILMNRGILTGGFPDIFVQHLKKCHPHILLTYLHCRQFLFLLPTC
jgi:hypothetical protein